MTPPPFPLWLPASGAAAARIRDTDWDATPLGAPARWPASLRTFVAFLLSGRAVMTLLWGEQATFFCNDAFIDEIDPEAGAAIGRSAFDAYAPSRAHFDAVLTAVLAGETVQLTRQRYPVRGRATEAEAWFDITYLPVRREDGVVAGALVTMVETTASVHADERLHLLVSELQHRTRNVMGVVRAMADRTGASSRNLADFRARFDARLAALSRVHGLLSRLGESDRLTFDALIGTQLAAMDGGSGQVTLAGPAGVRLRTSGVQTLAMALHELATNAVKYGALGQPQARLEVRWRLVPSQEDGAPWLHIDWRERGVVLPPHGGSGQGRELIEQALPYQLQARTTFAIEPDGVHCTIALPVSTTMSAPSYPASVPHSR